MSPRFSISTRFITLMLRSTCVLKDQIDSEQKWVTYDTIGFMSTRFDRSMDTYRGIEDDTCSIGLQRFSVHARAMPRNEIKSVGNIPKIHESVDSISKKRVCYFQQFNSVALTPTVDLRLSRGRHFFQLWQEFLISIATPLTHWLDNLIYQRLKHNQPPNSVM